MSSANNLHNYLRNIADGIREVKEKTDEKPHNYEGPDGNKYLYHASIKFTGTVSSEGTINQFIEIWSNKKMVIMRDPYSPWIISIYMKKGNELANLTSDYSCYKEGWTYSSSGLEPSSYTTYTQYSSMPSSIVYENYNFNYAHSYEITGDIGNYYTENTSASMNEILEYLSEPITPINAQNFPLEIRNLKPKSPMDNLKSYLQSIDLILPEETINEILYRQERGAANLDKSIIQIKMSNGEYAICLSFFRYKYDMVLNYNSTSIGITANGGAGVNSIGYYYYDNYVDNVGRPWRFNSYPSGYGSGQNTSTNMGFISLASNSQITFEEVKLIPIENILYTQTSTEKYDSPEELLTGIANAIREVNEYPLIQKINAQDFIKEIKNIDTSSSFIIEPFSIFNHGNVVGMNPYISTTPYMGLYWYRNGDEKFYRSPAMLDGCMKIPYLVDTRMFKKLYFEADVTEENTRNNKRFRGGLVAYSRYGTSNPPASPVIDREAICVNYANKSNYTNTEPWYLLPRTVIEVDLSNFPEDYGYIIFHACDLQPNIYSIWLE